MLEWYRVGETYQALMEGFELYAPHPAAATFSPRLSAGRRAMERRGALPHPPSPRACGERGEKVPAGG
jgi:hypothetical protein